MVAGIKSGGADSKNQSGPTEGGHRPPGLTKTKGNLAVAEKHESDVFETLQKDVSRLKEIVIEGNGHSLVTQIALIVQDIEAIHKNLDERDQNLRRELRIGLAVATGAIGTFISIWNLVQ